jgi:hypothetical protein
MAPAILMSFSLVDIESRTRNMASSEASTKLKEPLEAPAQGLKVVVE